MAIVDQARSRRSRAEAIIQCRCRPGCRVAAVDRQFRAGDGMRHRLAFPRSRLSGIHHYESRRSKEPTVKESNCLVRSTALAGIVYSRFATDAAILRAV
jgi:hypothetical protein